MSDRSYDKLRHVTKSEKKRLAVPPNEPWVPIRATMFSSPAHRSLTLAARRILDRFVVEHCDHGRRENGRLKVSYDDFVEWGLDRHSIRPSLDELERLGFIKCTTRGRRAHGEDPGWVATYRLCAFAVVGSSDAGPATDEWKRLSEEEVAAIQAELRAKRAEKKGRRRPVEAVADDVVIVPFRLPNAA